MKLPNSTRFGTKLIVAGVLFIASFTLVLTMAGLLSGALGLTIDAQKDFLWLYLPIAILCLGLNLLYARLSGFDRQAMLHQLAAAAAMVVLPMVAIVLRR